MNRHMAIAFAVSLVLVGIGARLLEHPANFTPIAAIALFAGYAFDRRWSWAIALAAVFLSDLVLGFYHGGVMLAVYGSYVVSWLLGVSARAQQTRWALAPSVLLGSVVFFTVTNFAVWAFTPLYEKTFSGLALAYAMGVPFFKWTLLGDVLYSLALLAILELAFLSVEKKRFISVASAAEHS
jgi:hypothetical protein